MTSQTAAVILRSLQESQVKEVSGEELVMLEIVWRNPNRLVPGRVILDKTLRHNSETGEAETVYYRRAATAGEDVEFLLVVNARQPMHAA
jgi:hypothetical protein